MLSLRNVLALHALLAGCGGPPITMHASIVQVASDTSSLDSTAQGELRASITPTPEREAVAHRLYLLAHGIRGVSSSETHDLLESTIAWAAVLRDRGWLATASRCTPQALDLPIVLDRLATMAARPTLPECPRAALALAAVRGTRGALERESSTPHAVEAWTNAMVELRTILDDCPRDGSELAAVAAAMRYHGDVEPGVALTARSPLGACSVATLAGQSVVEEGDATGTFATSCWIRGGATARQCGAVHTLGSEMDVMNSSVDVPDAPDAPVVYVEIGTEHGAQVYFVAQLRGEWRVVQSWLGWSR
jgi:hypothetical protein